MQKDEAGSEHAEIQFRFSTFGTEGECPWYQCYPPYEGQVDDGVLETGPQQVAHEAPAWSAGTLPVAGKSNP